MLSRLLILVVAWNLHGGKGDIPRLLAELESGSLINSTSDGARPAAVVLLLQEARRGGPSGVDAVARARGLFHYFAPVRLDDGVEQGNAVLSTAPLMEPRAMELPRERQRRVAQLVSISVQGQRLLLVNVHLENRAAWWKGALPGDRARERQMRTLLAALPSEVPGVLGGDFNSWFGEHEAAYRLAREAFPDGAPDRAPPTFREKLRLDHLFLRLPPGWRAQHVGTLPRYGSDHRPVLTAITIGV